MSKNLSITLLAVLLLTACSSTPAPQSSGTLEGHVTIGPQSPVIRKGDPGATPTPEAYAAWPIIVYQPDGKTEVARTTAGADGNYRIELPAGKYIVDTVHRGVGGAAALPKEIEITVGGTTRLDIDFDTGIR
jgi:hypothetical protein